LITIAFQLTCVVDKEILCTDNESLAQLLNVPSCGPRVLTSRPSGLRPFTQQQRLLN
jgi:hypothetical protein